MGEAVTFHKTRRGLIILGDSLLYMAGLKAESADLIVTSPPFGLVRKKDYGNVEKPRIRRLVQTIRARVQANSKTVRLARNTPMVSGLVRDVMCLLRN